MGPEHFFFVFGATCCQTSYNKTRQKGNNYPTGNICWVIISHPIDIC